MNRGKGSTRRPRSAPRKKVTTEFLLLFYEAFLRDREETKIAAALDTSWGNLEKWIAKFPELKFAKEMAIKRRTDSSTLSGYVLQRLSKETREIWDRIQFWKDSESVNDKIDELLSDKPTRVRQEIFIHALLHYSFSLSEACRIAGISRGTLSGWRRDDLGFVQLLEEIEWHKRNYFEAALVDLVTAGNPHAIMFVNRTKNADRGYNERMTVEHSGEITLGFSIDELNLPLETRKEILHAIRQRKELDKQREMKQLPQGEAEPIDV